MKASLNNIRLRDKMLLVYFLCVLIPILVTNLIFYNVTTNNVREQRMKDITRAIEQVKSEFRTELEDTIEISLVFYTDHLLNETLETEYTNAADYIEAYDSYLRRIINTYSPVYNSVEGITIYVDNPTLLYSGGISFIDEKVKQEPWYQAILNTPTSQPLVVRTGEEGTLDTFSVIRRMDYFYSENKHEKYMKIDMRMSSIRQIFNNLNLQGEVYLLNDRNEIEYTTNPDVNVSQHAVPFSEIELADDSIQFNSYYTMTNNLDGWSIIGTISEDEVLKEVRQSSKFVIILTLLNILLPTWIIIWITRSLNIRLISILKHVKKVKNQNFEVIEVTPYRDEIGQLTDEFNRMTLQIKSLINDVYVADIQKKDLEIQRRHAQLNALQSQINPHFLFNALETIRMRSLMKDEDETAHIIHNMAKIFRNSLVWHRDMITLREELEFIHCFLEIQRYRFGEKINYVVNASREDYDCLIPKMSIITFVENASIHGIEPMKQGGNIEIDIRREEHHLVVAVKDNGAGMSQEKIDKLYNYMNTETQMGERIGIQNVIYRLKLYYGNRYKLRIDSTPGEGTKIHLTIPLEH